MGEHPASRRHARRLVRGGWWIMLGAVLPLGTWMAVAPLSMAVVAPGVVKVELNRRPVQHREGGIVRAVLVRDGQRVEAGETILILGDVGVDADRNRLTYRVDVELAALARHEAEQSLAPTLEFSRDLAHRAKRDPRVQEALAKEAALFEARRDSLRSEVTLMAAHREQVEKEIAALEAQVRQAETSLTLQRSELETNRELIKGGYLAPIRVVQLEAAVLDYAAKLEERRSELARAGQRLVETDLRIKGIRNDFVKAASDQFKVTGARLGEIDQELRKSVDAAGRQIVVAPASGEVIDLRFTSPGAVVRAGEPIAEIVPHGADLVVEALVRPEEISHVAVEQRARVRFTAFKHRATSMVTGTVTYVSGDRLLDRATSAPYYSALIALDPRSLEAAGGLPVQAGMPAEVYIEGATQTPLQYLVEPITATIRRAGRQM